MNQNGSVVPAGTAGIVTLSESVMMPDGVAYKYIWARHWVEVPQPEKPPEKPKDGEFEYATLVGDRLWGLEGWAGELKEVFIPGCDVRGFARCLEVPERTDIYLCVKGADDS